MWVRRGKKLNWTKNKDKIEKYKDKICPRCKKVIRFNDLKDYQRWNWTQNGRIYCSKKCSNVYRNIYYSQPKAFEPNGGKCKICNKELTDKQYLFCCIKCKKRDYYLRNRERIKKKTKDYKLRMLQSK